MGFPLRLHLYNMANDHPDFTYQVWLDRKPKRRARLTNFLSKKQVDRLGESFLVKGANTWLKQIGEAPSIVDSTKIQKSLKRLKGYYGSKGYFNAETSHKIDSASRKQRAEVTYNVSLGKPFILDTIQKEIKSSAIDSLFIIHNSESHIKQKERFDFSNFKNERERLTQLFINSGIYGFQESSIKYDLKMDTIKLSDDQKLDLTLHIDNPKGKQATEYKVHRMNKINVYAEYDYAESITDSLKTISYKNFDIHYKGKLKYSPKAISESIFFKTDSVYRDKDRIRTYRKFASLNNFKYPSIKFIPDSTHTRLNTDIYLNSREKFSLGFNVDITHSNINKIGTAFNTNLNIRNVFGGLENLNITGRGSIGLLSDNSNPDENFVTEIGGDIKLSIPRFAFPFINSSKIVPFHMLPTTNISIGTSFQKNIGLDKQTFNSKFGYKWSKNEFRKNTLALLDIEFINNLNPDAFYFVYDNTYEQLDDVANDYQNQEDLQLYYEQTGNPLDPLRLKIPTGTEGFTNEILNNGLAPIGSTDYNDVNRIEERRKRLTENNLIFSSHYTYNKTSRKDLTDQDFYSLKGPYRRSRKRPILSI